MGAFLLLASGNVNTTAVPAGAELRTAAPVLLAILGLALLAARSQGRVRGLALSSAAGISYGFTSLLLRSLAQDLQAGGFAGVAIGTVAAVAFVMAVGGWLMQQSYAAGPPQLAVASVTVVDPIVAVLIGAFLLGEAAGLPWWVGAGELIAAALAIGGVIALASAQVGRGKQANTAPTHSIGRLHSTSALAV